MIAIGKLVDLRDYPNLSTFSRDAYTWEDNRRWLDDALALPFPILVVSSDVSGVFGRELRYLSKRGASMLLVGKGLLLDCHKLMRGNIGE